jgi:hypothetical protein
MQNRQFYEFRWLTEFIELLQLAHKWQHPVMNLHSVH